uniref:FecR domain-containing protein n=1 Tax=Prevotella sp. GTC17260 TaxID=3236796 RepID=A0AB33J9M8_9BACT
MSESEKQNIEYLLPLYMEGKLDEQQVQQVETWLNESDDHQHIAQNMDRAYQALDNLYIAEHTDTEQALKRLNNRLWRTRMETAMRKIERVAAILFIPLLLSAAVMFYQNYRSHSVEMLSVATNPGMTATALLPDGTKVTLNSNSRLTYPAQFDGDERQVSLSGEAYFDVSKDQKHPFIVKTPYDAHVKVYGTHFNLEIDNETHQVISTLVEGSIGLNYMTPSRQWNERRIHPGQQIVYSANEHQARVFDTETDVATSWKDGMLIFRNTPLTAVLRSLSKRFDINFIVRHPSVYHNRFTGTLKRQRLERILEILSISSNMKFRYVPNADIEKQAQTIEIY